MPTAVKKFETGRHNQWVKKIQDLKNKGAGFELMALRALLEFEQTSIAWKKSPGHTFADVLRDERLFPVSRWRSFKRANKSMKPTVIDSLGVQAACLIAAQTQRKQFRLIRKAQDYRKKYGVEATYQYIGEFLKKSRPKTDKGPSRKLLVEYIGTLQNNLKDNKLSVPKEPWL